MQIFYELLDSEERYVEKLDTIVSQYITPVEASKGSLMNASDAKLIFGNIRELRDLHKPLLQETIDVGEAFPPLNAFLLFFKKLMANFKMYVDYCNGHREAARQLSRLTSSNAKLKDFLHNAPTKDDLSDLLLSPIIKLLSYPKAVREMSKHTSKELMDYTALDELLKKLEKSTGLDAKFTRQNSVLDYHSPSENLRKLKKLQKEMSGLNSSGFLVTEPGRRLVREGQVTMSTNKRGGATVQLYLFNDTLLWARKAGLLSIGATWSYDGHTELKNCIAEDPEETKLWFKMDRMDSAKKVHYQFSFKDMKSKLAWWQDLTHCIDNALSNESRKYRGGAEIDLEYLKGLKMSIEHRNTLAPRPASRENTPKRTHSRNGSRSGSRPGSRPGSRSGSRANSANKLRPSVSGNLGMGADAKMRPIPADGEDIDLTGDTEYMRHEAIDEVLQSERVYVNDLQSIVAIFLRPAREEKVASPEQINDIFLNVEELLEVNKALLVKLEDRVNSSNSHELGIGDIFVAMAKDLRVYTSYCNSHGKAAKTLNKCRETKDFRRFLEVRSEYPEVNRLDLTDFLIKPVQRVLKYKLLIRELLRYTDYNHSDHEHLVAALRELDQVSHYIDEKKGEQDNDSKIRDIESRIEKLEVKPLADGKRKWIREGDLLKEKGKSGKLESTHVVLFSDLMILAKPSFMARNKFTVSSTVWMDAATVQGMPDSPKLKNAFKILDAGTGSAVVLVATSSFEKEEWMRMIKKQSERLDMPGTTSTSLSKPSSLTGSLTGSLGAAGASILRHGSFSSNKGPPGLPAPPHGRHGSFTGSRPGSISGMSPLTGMIGGGGGRARAGSMQSSGSQSSMTGALNDAFNKKAFIKPAPKSK